MKSFFKGFFVTILVVVLGLFAFNTYINLGEPTETKAALKDLQDSNEKFQVLIIGVDSLNARGAKNTRSDVMMLLDVDGEKKTASLTSIPRDSRVHIDGHGKTKINHAYAYGGAELALETVNEKLGLHVPYYIVVDYAFVKEVVDILGGIEVHVPMDMDYEDPTADPPLSIHLKQGLQTLDGEEALQFLRFRKGYKNADLDRVKAQQAFFSAFVAKLKSVGGILRSPSLLVSYLDNTTSNMPLSKVSRMGLTLLSVGRDNFHMATLPGTPTTIDGLSYFVIDEAEAEKQLKETNVK